MSTDFDLKAHYNTILCQAFSPDGRYLFAGNIYGDISVFDLPLILNRRQNGEEIFTGPAYQFKANKDCYSIQSMITTENFLIVGIRGQIIGWDVKFATSSKCNKMKPNWVIQIPNQKDGFDKSDVNSLKYSKEKNHIYAGCGDNKIYIINLENGKILHSLDGHENFIHSLSLCEKQIVSGSEDGTVRLWDLRKKENTNILQPHLHEKVKRPNLGKWIGAVEMTDDWLICGGGPKLSMWHIRSMEPATVFDLPDEGIHIAELYEERIIAGGIMPYLHHLNFQSTTLAKVPTSSKIIYSVVYQEHPYKVLTISGSSNYIDLCSNFNYRELVLKFS